MIPRRLLLSAAASGALLLSGVEAARALAVRSAERPAEADAATGGPVMTGRPAVYLLWYGDWTGSKAVPLLTDFASTLGGSSHFRINSTYGAASELRYGGAATDPYSKGLELSDGDVRDAVLAAIASGALPSDPEGIYAVLASSDVDQGPGLCSSYCSWRRRADAGGPDLKYAFVGNPARCPAACQTQPRGPNGDAAADAMAAALGHELSATVTNRAGDADPCAWSFGATNSTADGARYNVVLEGRPYLLHRLRVNAAKGYCAPTLADVPSLPLPSTRGEGRVRGPQPSPTPQAGAGASAGAAIAPEPAADLGVPAEIPGVAAAPVYLDRRGPPPLQAAAQPQPAKKQGFFASLKKAVMGAVRRSVDAVRSAAQAATDVLGLGRRAARPVTQPPLRGVNLGGWLVLERWMTDGLFRGTEANDEFTLSQAPGGPERIERHRKTFIVEEDFRWLRDHGVNAVRIPVGYWIFGDAPPFVGGLERLDWAFAMAAKYKLQVLLDLHGAPGSQNGKDHSGRTGKADWYDSSEHRAATLRALERLQDRYGQHPRLWGLELMNEPMPGVSPPKFWRLYWWTRDAVLALAKRGAGGYQLVFSDAYVPWLWSGRINHSRAVMDVHHYQCFNASDKKKTIAQHEATAAGMAGKIAGWQKRQPVVIGEWSLALDGATLGVPHAEAEPRYAKAQLEAYSGAAGWFYWSYKTEGKGTWNFRSLVESGVLRLK